MVKTLEVVITSLGKLALLGLFWIPWRGLRDLVLGAAFMWVSLELLQQPSALISAVGGGLVWLTALGLALLYFLQEAERQACARGLLSGDGTFLRQEVFGLSTDPLKKVSFKEKQRWLECGMGTLIVAAVGMIGAFAAFCSGWNRLGEISDHHFNIPKQLDPSPGWAHWMMFSLLTAVKAIDVTDTSTIAAAGRNVYNVVTQFPLFGPVFESIFDALARFGGRVEISDFISRLDYHPITHGKSTRWAVHLFTFVFDFLLVAKFKILWDNRLLYRAICDRTLTPPESPEAYDTSARPLARTLLECGPTYQRSYAKTFLAYRHSGLARLALWILWPLRLIGWMAFQISYCLLHNTVVLVVRTLTATLLPWPHWARFPGLPRLHFPSKDVSLPVRSFAAVVLTHMGTESWPYATQIIEVLESLKAAKTGLKPKSYEAAVEFSYYGDLLKILLVALGRTEIPASVLAEHRCRSDKTIEVPRAVGEEWTNSSFKMAFRGIPNGRFRMGTNFWSWSQMITKATNPEEQKRLTALSVREKFCSIVVRRDYYIAETPVTQRMYEEITGHNPSVFQAEYFDGHNFPDNANTLDFPVENLSWYEAHAFCAWVTLIDRRQGRLPKGWYYRLPSEAQWERACKAGTDDSLGSEKPDDVWQRNNSGGTTHAVRLKPVNAWGLADMCGNVEEWTSDWYTEDTAQVYKDDQGNTQVSGSVINNSPHERDHSTDEFRLGTRAAYLVGTNFAYPVESEDNVPLTGSVKCARGGSFQSDRFEVLASSRIGYHPSHCSRARGFRIVLIAPERGGRKVRWPFKRFRAGDNQTALGQRRV